MNVYEYINYKLELAGTQLTDLRRYIISADNTSVLNDGSTTVGYDRLVHGKWHENTVQETYPSSSNPPEAPQRYPTGPRKTSFSEGEARNARSAPKRSFLVETRGRE